MANTKQRMLIEAMKSPSVFSSSKFSQLVDECANILKEEKKDGRA